MHQLKMSDQNWYKREALLHQRHQFTFYCSTLPFKQIRHEDEGKQKTIFYYVLLKYNVKAGTKILKVKNDTAGNMAN